MRKTSIKGFTLIELLVVITIIGILSSIVLVNLNDVRRKSRDSKRVSDLKQLQLALAVYYNDNAGFPSQSFQSVLPSPISPAYISTLPVDPVNDGSDCTNLSHKYCYWGNGNSYVIQAVMESSSAGLQQGTTTEWSGGPSCNTAGFYCVSS